MLQKREEAEVSFAVTEPTIKVIEYALSSDIPISPKKQIIFLGLSFFIGSLILAINVKFYEKYALLSYIIGILLLFTICSI